MKTYSNIFAAVLTLGLFAVGCGKNDNNSGTPAQPVCPAGQIASGSGCAVNPNYNNGLNNGLYNNGGLGQCQGTCPAGQVQVNPAQAGGQPCLPLVNQNSCVGIYNGQTVAGIYGGGQYGGGQFGGGQFGGGPQFGGNPYWGPPPPVYYYYPQQQYYGGGSNLSLWFNYHDG